MLLVQDDDGKKGPRQGHQQSVNDHPIATGLRLRLGLGLGLGLGLRLWAKV
jgi:hypothetical protein